ncbi:hypothetical protein ACFLT9_05910 [Acidobacteriota bacterium]
MKSKRAIFFIIGMVLTVCFFCQSCAILQEVANTFANISRLQFKLGSVHNFRLAGIDISRISAITQFSLREGATLVQAFGNRKLPADFVLDVLVRNPNDGTGGTSKTSATLIGFESRLLIDDSPTIFGNIEAPMEIPGVGTETVIQLRLGLDLYEFFGNKGYEGLISLILAIGGANRSSTRLALDAKPSVSTPYGRLEYPGRITVISKEFR